MNSDLDRVGYVAVRKAENCAREYFLLDEINILPEDVTKAIERRRRIIPEWHEVNPVQRIAKVSIKVIE